jgi:hypothetical protein
MAKAYAGKFWLALAATSLLFSGCIKDDPKPTEPSAESPPATSAPPTSSNSKPSISGTPPTSILEGEAYDFRPSATDPDGDRLTFSVSNKPTWASFDSTTGRLYGTPGAGTSGSYGNIVISVSDGTAQASLSGYTLTVQQIGTGSATLSWNPPTQNTDGSALTDLAGYKIYYGKSSTNLDKIVTIASAGITRYVVENLTSATWYFSMTSYNSTGVESSQSTAVSKTIS